MEEHTPEPWQVGKIPFDQPVIIDMKSVGIATLEGGWKFNHEANARRIVACVNACAGIPLDELEVFATSSPASSAKKDFWYLRGRHDPAK